MTESSYHPETPLTTVVADGTPRGGVVVVQEAYGITAYIEDVLKRFAAAGWTAIAPHLFHRFGDPVIPYDDASALQPIREQLNAADIDTDVDAALSALADAGFEPQQCAVVGFCMGGQVALQTAVRRPLGAAVTFYGGGVAQGRFGYPALVEVAGGLQAPWLGLYGDQDAGIPVEQVEQLHAVVTDAPVPTELVRYPEGKHGFHCDGRPDAYNAAAATDSWRRALEWLGAHVAHPGTRPG